MEKRQLPAVAAVSFASARAAGRRVAGVAVAGRIVRELADAGFVTAWLAVPAGEAIDAAAMRDVRRLAGAMEVRLGEPPADAHAVVVPPDRADSVDLAQPGAGREILRRTGKATDGPVSRWLNRPISRAISALVLRIPGFTPLHATAGSAVLGASMFGALFSGESWGLIVGGVLFQAASVLDGVDGEVARATFRSSRFGARLDTALDTLTTVLFVVGLTVNLASSGYRSALPLAGWGLALFLLGLALVAGHAARTGGSLNFLRIKRHYRGRFSSVLLSRFVAFATLVSSRDFFALFFALLTVAGWPMGVLYWFAAAASLWILFVAGSLLPLRKDEVAAETA